MQTVRIYRLKDLDRWTRARLKAAQLEAARVWMYCLQRHQAARTARTRWPDRDDLQRETKGGQFSLHSQSIQMVCQQFLANVETIKQLRQTNPRHRYPYHPKRYMMVQWPAQAVCRQSKRLILPLGGATRLHQRRPGVRSVSATSHAGPLGNGHRRERFRLEAHPFRGDGSVTRVKTVLKVEVDSNHGD